MPVDAADVIPTNTLCYRVLSGESLEKIAALKSLAESGNGITDSTA